MGMYKVHSIKDSEKLSFILESENEALVNKKLLGEGHIILSIEKVTTPGENLFCFEGKKTDGSFIEGKISAEDIFEAYEILLRNYKYSLTKLYPEKVTEKEKQDKLFQELLLTFTEKGTQKIEKGETDTARQQVLKLRKIIQKLIPILQKYSNEENSKIILELRKLDQNNNFPLIQQALKEIGLKLADKRNEKNFFHDVRPILPELGVNLPPEAYYSVMRKWQGVRRFLSPLLRTAPKGVPQIIPINPQENTIQRAYDTIQGNKHIYTFLRKKYRKKIGGLFVGKTKKYYIYTLLRERGFFFLLQNLCKSYGILTRVTVFTIFVILMIVTFLGFYSALFVTTKILIVFAGCIFISLVIQGEAV